MRCLVCWHEHADDADCPICGFPAFVDMDFSSREEASEKLKSYIADYKRNLLDRLDFGVMTYRWKDADGKLTADGVRRAAVAKGAELASGERWLEEKFARIPDTDKITLRLSVLLDGKDCPKDITVTNPAQKELQQVGLRLDDDMQISVLLRNSAGMVESEPQPLFD